MTGVWYVKQVQTNNDEATDYGIEDEDVQSDLDSTLASTVEVELFCMSLLGE